MMNELAAMGGFFALLSFWHFVADWGFQSHEEAMNKARDGKVRAWHCTVYTVLMAPLVFFLCGGGVAFWSSVVILWGSHFLIDTYIPVYMWAKYVRKAPVFDHNSQAIDFFSKKTFAKDTDLERMKAWARDPLGLVLMIVVDQIFHMLFLLPVASLAAWPGVEICYIVAGFMLAFLIVMVMSGVENLKRTDDSDE